jgi:hypothetical protein
VELDAKRRPDPQWDFALLIRSALERGETWVAEVDTRDAQAMVDIRWAARQAGRLLGVAVDVHMSPPYGHANSISTVTLRSLEGDPAERALAAAGLEKLLRSVREAQRVVYAGDLVPEPRSPEPAIHGAGPLPPPAPLR